MPVTSETETTKNSNGETVEKLHLEFSNGALVQLKELAKFFGAENEDPREAVLLAISLLQNIKEKKEESSHNKGE